MVATVEICESNGAGETVTHNISNLNFGSVDAANLTPASYPIVAGENSFLKYVRMHWTSGTANKLENFRCWKSAGAYVTGEGIQTNLKTSGYSPASYATPTQTTFTDQAMPVADPGSQNVGCGGTLTGYLSSAGYTDYIKLQLQTTGSTPPGDVNQKTFIFQYDES